jgi:hypothetical protein
MMHFSFRNPVANEPFGFGLMTCSTLHNPARCKRAIVSRALKRPVFKPEIAKFHAKGEGSTIAMKFG